MDTLTTWGRVSCNDKTASLPRELCELVSLQTSREKQCHRPSHHTRVDYWREVIEHRPLVMWQSLGQSEAFPPFRAGQPQPIRDFSTIEPGTLQCHNTKTYKKRCTCTSGTSLEGSQLVYTSGLYQSVALRLILHCGSQEGRLSLRSSSHFKQ